MKMWHEFWASYHYSKSYGLHGRYVASSDAEVLFHMNRYEYHLSKLYPN